MNTRGGPQLASKKPTLAIISLAVWLTLLYLVVWPWVKQIDLSDRLLSILAHITAAVWWLVVLWTLHHLSYQLYSLLSSRAGGVRAHRPSGNSAQPGVAILYCTRDDFNPESCQSCVNQDYARARVLICDDSSQEGYREQARAFVGANKSRCTLVTRSSNRGFKAGNLNNAITHHVAEEWILLVDADQLLPPDYLSLLVSSLPPDISQVPFVQAAHRAGGASDSPFQEIFAPEVELYYSRDLPARESFGFVPFLGHGVLLRKSVWTMVGGFPEVVSEDFAFAMEISNRGQRGIRREVESNEAFPYDFGGFMVRLRKFAGGTAELMRTKALRFLLGRATVVEKWDFGLQLFWYMLMPLVTLNGFLTAYVTHRLWSTGIPYLHPALPYLYTWLFLTLFALKLSVTRSWGRAAKFYSWATAVYAAAMPLASLSFARHLFSRPVFARTPKNEEQTRPGLLESGPMILLGLVAVGCAGLWVSPFSPFLAGQGVAYLCFPLYGELCSDSLVGRVARLLIHLPALLTIFALYAVWAWARY